jgi:hypothetical protein
MKTTVVSLLYIIVIKSGKESNSIQDPSHWLNILTRDKLIDWQVNLIFFTRIISFQVIYFRNKMILSLFLFFNKMKLFL